MIEKDRNGNIKTGSLLKKQAIAGVALGGLLVGANYAWPANNQSPEKTPMLPTKEMPQQQFGDHHNLAEMPSTVHLKQFSQEHGVVLNKK